MGRAKRKKDERAARVSRAMTLTPPIDPTVMESRVLGHLKLMKDLLDRGLSFRSVPVNVIKNIVRDFQIAGLAVPPSALQLVHEHTQETPPRRPAPIWMDPLKMRSIRGDDQPELPYAPMDTRQDAIANNINPKTGHPGYGGAAAAAATMPVPPVTGGGAKLFTTNSAIPYTPQYRYTKPLGVGQWLPPWMVSGSQPNQFVKSGPPRPMRPMGVGVRPGYRAGDQITRPTDRVMLPQAPNASQLPYTFRPMGEAAAIARYGGAGPAIAAAQGMTNPPRADRGAAFQGMQPIPVPGATAENGASSVLDLEGIQPIVVPNDNSPPPVPDRARKPVLKRRSSAPDEPKKLPRPTYLASGDTYAMDTSLENAKRTREKKPEAPRRFTDDYADAVNRRLASINEELQRLKDDGRSESLAASKLDKERRALLSKSRTVDITLKNRRAKQQRNTPPPAPPPRRAIRSPTVQAILDVASSPATPNASVRELPIQAPPIPDRRNKPRLSTSPTATSPPEEIEDIASPAAVAPSKARRALFTEIATAGSSRLKKSPRPVRQTKPRTIYSPSSDTEKMLAQVASRAKTSPKFKAVARANYPDDED